MTVRRQIHNLVNEFTKDATKCRNFILVGECVDVLLQHSTRTTLVMRVYRGFGTVGNFDVPFRSAGHISRRTVSTPAPWNHQHAFGSTSWREHAHTSDTSG